MTENIENSGCSQRDSAEHEGYAKAWHTNSDRPNPSTSTDGSITEYVCAYGNSGNYPKQRRET